MKLSDGRITLLVDSDERRIGMHIELYDFTSSTTFAKIYLNPEQMAKALSRLGYTPCSIEMYNLDKLGKKMEHKPFKFKIKENLYFKDNKKKLARIAKRKCPEGWEPDTSFDSQNSTFKKNGKTYAQTTIRRWVDIED